MYGNSAPGPKQFSEIFEIIDFHGKVSSLRFKRALNHPQPITLGQIMQEIDFGLLCPYMEIRCSPPRRPHAAEPPL